MVRHPYNASAILDLDCIVRNPVFPSPGQRIAGLGHEAAVQSEGRPYRGQRLSQLFVFDQHLECVTGHYYEVELLDTIRLTRGRHAPTPRPAASEPAPASRRRGRVRTVVLYARPPGPGAAARRYRNRRPARSPPTSPVEGRRRSPVCPHRTRHTTRRESARKTGDRPPPQCGIRGQPASTRGWRSRYGKPFKLRGYGQLPLRPDESPIAIFPSGDSCITGLTTCHSDRREESKVLCRRPSWSLQVRASLGLRGL